MHGQMRQMRQRLSVEWCWCCGLFVCCLLSGCPCLAVSVSCCLLRISWSCSASCWCCPCCGSCADHTSCDCSGQIRGQRACRCTGRLDERCTDRKQHAQTRCDKSIQNKHSHGEACAGQMRRRQDRTYTVKTKRHVPATSEVMVGGNGGRGTTGHTQSNEFGMHQRLTNSWMEARSDIHRQGEACTGQV